MARDRTLGYTNMVAYVDRQIGQEYSIGEIETVMTQA